PLPPLQEYATPSPRTPAGGVPADTTVSAPGNVPGASSHRTSPVTWYVPLSPVGMPILSKVSQVPPPVTALDLPAPPAGATKVPEPVRVTPELSSARAESAPPAPMVRGWDEKVAMSHRMCAAWAWATGA